MNSCQRVMTALRGGKPDRVPVVEFVIDPKVARAALPQAADVPDFCDRMDMDAVGCGAVFNKVRDLPDGSYLDEWGVRYKPGPEVVAHPLEGPIRSRDDLKRYTPPDPRAEGRLGMLPDLVRRYKGKRAIIFHQRAAFMGSAYLMGIDHLLAAFLDEPDLAQAVMDKVLEVNLEIARQAIKVGADVIVLGDDYAHNTGPLMSPAVFRQFLLPRLKKMVDTIHEQGGLCIKHSDGNIYCLLDMIVSTGIDGLNPIEPVAGMDLAETRKRGGPKLCLVGNIDCGHLLPWGTPLQVEDAVRKAMADGGAHGAFMVSSSNSIHSSCKPENLLAMIQAVHQWGTYA